MSQMELHIGEIEKAEFPLGIESFEERVKNLQSRGLKIEDVELEDEYFWSREVVYSKSKKEFYIVNDKECDPDCLHTVTKVGNKIKYITNFYNGGTCLQEVLEDIIEEETV